MKYFRRLIPELLPLLVICFFIFLSTRAMFHEGFFRTIDDVTTVRIDHLRRELTRGYWSANFPVRLGAELAHNYGYFFYLFYAPMVYYAGALLMMIGNLSDIMATKAVYAMPLIFGPILFYLAARLKLSRLPSVVGTVLFTLFPYRGFDAYFRGGVGENWAISFLPGLFAGIFLQEKKHPLAPFLIAIFFALVIVSHNIAAIMVAALTILYGLIFLRRNISFWLSLMLGLGLSAFFWLPSGYYLGIIGANSIELNTTFILSTLLPIWEIIKPDLTYSPSRIIVQTFFYLILSGLIAFIFTKSKSRWQGIFWFGLSLFLYLLLSRPFAFFWQLSLPITRTFQFSWRVMIILSFTFPLAVSYLLSVISNKLIKYLIAILIIFLSLTFLPSFRPKEYSYFYSYTAGESSQCGTSTFEEYFPKWVGECVNQTQKEEIGLTGEGELKIDISHSINIEGSYSSESANSIMANKYYFPGWRVLVDGTVMPIDYLATKQGIIVAQVPAGTHSLQIAYRKTLVMWLADIISLVSIIIFLSGLTRLHLHRRIK